MKVFFQEVENYLLVGDYSNAEKADQIVREQQPDVVLMDIDMPGVNGIEGIHLIKNAMPETSIIMHTVFEDDQRLFESLCAGASGYLLKNTSFEQLMNAASEVLNGGAPMSPTIARKVLHKFQNQPQKNKYNLSPRELEVLQLLVKGYSYKMIATENKVTLSTIQAQIKNIYTKLHVNCGREAVVLALKDKIV